MSGLFLTVLNMSLKASYVILFVIVIRLFLKKIPKIYSYVLWFAVLFRLICPFSLDSIFSLIPRDVNIPQDIAYSPKPEVSSGITAIDSAVNNVLPPIVTPAASANPMQIWIAIGEAAWLIGIAVFIIYSIFTSVKLYRNLRYAKHLEDNIYIINGYKTPFVFGIVNPKIYLPYHLSESEKSYVLLHEQTHIKRLDHIVKLIFFIVTCIHWFNPLVWAAFYLMGEDMELSCDEKVVKQMGSSIKKEYSSSLLSMSTGRRILGGSPIAFGENNTEGRIKNILNYKKPSLWVLIVVSIVIVIFIIGLITNPKSNEAITWDRRPMIMVNGELYLDTGKEVSVEIDESAIIGKINSSVDQSEKPTEEGQTNFGHIGAKYAHFEDNIVVLINNEWVLFEKEINGIKEADKKRFYIMTADDGAPIGCEYGTTREVGEIDTLEMLSMLEELQGFVFDKDYVSEQYIEFQFLDEEPKEINLWYITKDELQTEYPIDSATYRIKVPANVGVYSFFADITWDNQKKETVFFDITIIANESTNYEKISSYLKEKSINAFSPYYEILDFIISNYKEEVVNGKVEAVCSYKLITKNYDRDPDTVEYIKEAKERGDKYYQTYYDEYLQPHENNFYFKAVIDENNEITLYSKNPAIENAEWIETMMSDYIIKKPEETGNKKSLTALEAMNLAYEEVKKVTDEEPMLIRFTSTDDTSVEQTINDGADGKRNAWNMHFGSANGNMSISVSIRDGVCYKGDLVTDDSNSLRKGIYTISDIKIDSSDAVKKSIELFNMKPGNPKIEDDWVKGYHFVIADYIIDPTLNKTKLLLRVTGISPNSPNSNNESLKMNVFFDVNTGKVFSATEQTGYDEEGRSMWKEIDVNNLQD